MNWDLFFTLFWGFTVPFCTVCWLLSRKSQSGASSLPVSASPSKSASVNPRSAE